MVGSNETLASWDQQGMKMHIRTVHVPNDGTSKTYCDSQAEMDKGYLPWMPIRSPETVLEPPLETGDSMFPGARCCMW